MGDLHEGHLFIKKHFLNVRSNAEDVINIIIRAIEMLIRVGVVVVQPRDEKAPGRPCSGFSVPKGKMGRESLSVIRQEVIALNYKKVDLD